MGLARVMGWVYEVRWVSWDMGQKSLWGLR